MHERMHAMHAPKHARERGVLGTPARARDVRAKGQEGAEGHRHRPRPTCCRSDCRWLDAYRCKHSAYICKHEGASSPCEGGGLPRYWPLRPARRLFEHVGGGDGHGMVTRRIEGQVHADAATTNRGHSPSREVAAWALMYPVGSGTLPQTLHPAPGSLAPLTSNAAPNVPSLDRHHLDQLPDV